MKLLLLTLVLFPVPLSWAVIMSGSCNKDVESNYSEGLDNRYLPLLEIAMPKEDIFDSFFTRSFDNYTRHIHFEVKRDGRIQKIANLFNNCPFSEYLLPSNASQLTYYDIGHVALDSVTCPKLRASLTHTVVKLTASFGVIWGCRDSNTSASSPSREVGVFVVVNWNNYDRYFEKNMRMYLSLVGELRNLLDFDKELYLGDLADVPYSDVVKMRPDDSHFSTVSRCYCEKVCCGCVPREDKWHSSLIYVVAGVLALIFGVVLCKICY